MAAIPRRDLEVLCFGAGGAAVALLLALFCEVSGPELVLRDDPPHHVTFADTRPEALRHLGDVAARAGIDPRLLTLTALTTNTDADVLLSATPAPCLVVNATGLGKTSPGSPLSPRARFRPDTIAWDLNYRGPLTFLRQAEAQAVPTTNGWHYFVASWTGALTTIAGIPLTAQLINDFEQAVPGPPERPPKA